jgi:hypothetical protein
MSPKSLPSGEQRFGITTYIKTRKQSASQEPFKRDALWVDLKEKKMALESFKAQISLLLEQMINQPEDQHEVQEQLREKLREMRAMGLPLPADLVALEKRLDDDFYAAGN